MRIFHIASVADWDDARRTGHYSTSTRGRTLAEEGFIHASRGDQWQGVRRRYYSDVAEPLVLLVVDTDLLTSPVVDEPAPGSPTTGETFPHVYGPIDVEAVVQTIVLEPPAAAAAPDEPDLVDRKGPTDAGSTPVEPGQSFSRLFLEEMFRNVLVASFVLTCVVAATLVGKALDDDWGPITGALLGLVFAVLALHVRGRRHARREESTPVR